MANFRCSAWNAHQKNLRLDKVFIEQGIQAPFRHKFIWLEQICASSSPVSFFVLDKVWNYCCRGDEKCKQTEKNEPGGTKRNKWEMLGAFLVEQCLRICVRIDGLQFTLERRKAVEAHTLKIQCISLTDQIFPQRMPFNRLRKKAF